MLTELTLLQFRSHRRAALVLDGRPVAIHGGNGAGKTNIIEAISLLSPGRGLRRAGAEELMRRNEAVGWKIRASLGNGQEIETSAQPNASREVRIDGKAAPQIGLSRVLRVVWLVPAMDRLWIEGAEGRRRFLDRLTLSFTPSHAESVLLYEKPCANVIACSKTWSATPRGMSRWRSGWRRRRWISAPTVGKLSRG